MPFEEILLTKTNLEKLDIEKITNECERPLVDQYGEAFNSIENSETASFLSAICSMRLTPENSSSPFSPLFVMHNKRGLIESDFPIESLKVLADYTNVITDHELKSRICDLVWITKTGTVEHAHQAVKSYLESAKQLLLLDNSNWIDAFQRIERSLRLSCVFKHSNQCPELYKIVSTFIFEEIERALTDENENYALRLVKLGAEHDIGKTNWLYEVASKLATKYFDRKDFLSSSDTWSIAQTVAKSLNNKDKFDSSWLEIAKCHEEHALSSDRALVSSGSMMKAIDALAKVPKTRQKRMELYEHMREFQLETMHQMTEHTIPMKDNSEIVNRAIQLSHGKDVFDSLFRLGVLVCQPTEFSRLRTEAEKQMRNSIAWIFSTVYLDHDGMVSDSVPEGLGIEDDDNGRKIWSIMMKNIEIDHMLAVRSQILPALNEVTCIHYAAEEDLLSFLNGHPFIPVGHEEFFAKGLAEGLKYEFLTASHLLVPQIENSLRYLLKQRGEEPSTLRGDGSQERIGLKELLEHPVIIEILGINIASNLQALLIDKIYGNLRNQLSHGFVESEYYFGTKAIYFWWLVLHILMNPFCDTWKEKYDAETILSKDQ